MTGVSARQALRRARQALKNGDRQGARHWAEQALVQDNRLEEAWLILASVSSPRASLAYARKALQINPQSQAAGQAVAWAQRRVARSSRALRAYRSDHALAATAPTRMRPVSPAKEPLIRKEKSASAAPRRRRGWFFLLAAVLILLAAGLSVQMSAARALLQGQVSPTPQVWATARLPKPTYTPSPTATAMPTASAAPTATPTAVAPTATLPPTVMPSATPTQTPRPRPTAMPSPVTETACQNLAAFVRDVTVPDGTQIQAGGTFTKTWRLQNAGTCTWTPDYALVFDSGNRLSGATHIALGRTVAPGETVDLSVELAAPDADGVYQGFWRLQPPQGDSFALAGGQSFWVKIRVGAAPTATPAPEPVEIPDEVDAHTRWIDVDLSRQMVYAYEGSTLVNSFLVSTGVAAHPTVTGQYHIYVKYRYADMSGPGYYLPDVPYTMYFYQGYGLHGTYWHHNFGTPMSHGCINLRTEDAGWLFNWASVGTLVNIHP